MHKTNSIRVAASRLRFRPTALQQRFQSSAATQTEELLATASDYLLPVYARPPFVLSHGRGSYVWDTNGRKYLDFSAGIAVNALGHGDEELVQVISEQTAKLLHTSNVYHNEWAPRLAQLLSRVRWREGVFLKLGHGGERGALKIARKVGKDRGGEQKTGIVCFENAFHGRSMGALSVTPNPKYQGPFAPLIPGVSVGKMNDHEGLQTLVTGETCAVIVEPIQGEGGVTAAHADWLIALRKRCDEVGAVLIFDEIQCGLYRSGNLWAHSTLPLEGHPDIVTMAKPLANGYPIGAVLLRNTVAETMTAGSHGTTFGGSPLACAVGYHVLSRLSSPEMASHIAETSAHLDSRLQQLPKQFPDVLEPVVRGRGLIRGLGFQDASKPGVVVEKARERGVFVLTAGKNAVRLVPSLNVRKEEVDIAVGVVTEAIREL
ncbi:unnamed protein product [Mycena citricolor]|uniref:Acetylornithine transaminase n=1 Tax=Mycena citricolor TaxID=2018698 RepID=A0AAD2K326_9AGAR|nr:unnamed protein product [Mycena citricolor]